MKGKLIAISSIVVTALLLNYLILIPINVRYLGSVVLFMLIVIPIYWILFPKKCITYKYEKINTEIGKKQLIKVPIFTKKVWLVLVVFIGIISIYGIGSSTIFFSKGYKNQIGVVEERPLDSNFMFDNISELPVIDNKVATILGDKKIGEDRGLGSEFRVGIFSDIIYQEKPYSVAPLEFNDFFKWVGNKSTPGYVLVDKKTGDTKLVRDINGKKIGMKYMPSAYFGNDLKRHAYFNGNMDNALGTYHFEIDESGNPYWVIPKVRKEVGIAGGDDVYSVVLVNAQTGKVDEYKVSEVPDWVDEIYPKDMVLHQLDNWGLFVNGFVNTMFSEKEIIRITNGSRHVYHDGDMYHYTGLTSAGKDESTVGFAFINARTKKTVFYTITGATEAAAMASAEGKVQNLRYTSSFPIPVNIDGLASFFMTLKDANGLIKQYAFVNINDYGKVGIGEDIESARSSYLKLMNKDDVTSETVSYTGIIKRIGSNNNNFYMMTEGNDMLFYSDNEQVNKILSISKIGDDIVIEVLNDSIKKVNNKTLGKES